MPEFRTTPPGQGGNDKSQSSGEFNLEGLAKQAYQQLLQNPQGQLRMAQALQENYGVPPDALVAIFPEMAEMAEKQQEQQAKQAENNQKNEEINVSTQEVKTVKEKPEPDDVIGFLDEVSSYMPEDMTLSELENWAENNKDLVQTAIDMKF
jgi:hypothetical protein